MGIFDKLFEDPKKKEAKDQFEKGIFYLRSNDIESALYHFKNATNIDPDNSGAWHMRGMMYRKLGNEAEALYCFDKENEMSKK